MNCIRMEYKVQFADILEALVQGLDKDLNKVEDSQFTLRGINAKYKV